MTEGRGKFTIATICLFVGVKSRLGSHVTKRRNIGPGRAGGGAELAYIYPFLAYLQFLFVIFLLNLEVICSKSHPSVHIDMNIHAFATSKF